MRFTNFQLPNTRAVKNKIITAFSMILIIISLYVTCYMLFFRTVDVDVTKAAEITYHGESGSATVKVSNKNQDYNQRIQEFMDSIIYQVSPSKRLKNGDVIKITAKYNEDLASRYHIHPTNKTRNVTIANLPIRYDGVDDISPTLLEKANKKGQEYLDKNMDSILNEDFTSFHITAKPQLVHSNRIYRIFLDSKKASVKDKIIDIFAITAKGEVNTSSEKETLEVKEETIYYMITYNEINTSAQILDENVYGEKIMNKANVDLTKESDFMKYITTKYGSIYTITLMNDGSSASSK